MSFEHTAKGTVVLRQVGKCYRRYHKPVDRLKEWLLRRSLAEEHWALRSVDLHLPPGQTLGLVGRNGAGKSTLLQLVAGTLAPSTGSIHKTGRVAALLELGAGFNPEFTGRENARLNGLLMGLTADELEARLPEIIEFADIGDAIDRPVSTYSSGMFVRLAFAVATALEPDILIIDEALSVGDGAFARKSFDRIMQMRERGVTTLFCSHSLYQVESLCDRVVWLENGQIYDDGSPKAVLKAYQSFLDRLDRPAPAASTPVPASVPAPGGSGRFTAIEVRCDGQQGRQLQAQSGKSEVIVRLAYCVDPDLPPPTVAVTWHLADGRIFASTGSHVEGVEVPRDEAGRGKVEICFPNLPLLKGHYWLSAFLMCERGIHFYEIAERIAEISVEQDDLEQGFVKLPRRWAVSVDDGGS